jgi:NADPH:quinone reductase-like Zn-dependent oxidoreductase
LAIRPFLLLINKQQMKAAVLHEFGQAPQYEEYSEPAVTGPNQLVITVKAAAIKNLDRIRASVAPYSANISLPVVIGSDGVGVLDDGTRVYATGLSGMMAERAIVDPTMYTVLPKELDIALAAVLPNAALGAAVALKFRAGLKPGATVLINGATGVTGRLAVQLAKYYGAGKVVATGREPEVLEKLAGLGADETISLQDDTAKITAMLKTAHRDSHFDIVIDYLWGQPAEIIFNALQGDGSESCTPTRYVTVGDMAGSTIKLASVILRNSAIELVGSGLGILSMEVRLQLHTVILPELMQLAAEGKLSFDTATRELKEVGAAWVEKLPAGKRLVILI